MTDGWLKRNFASCVKRQTRSFGFLGSIFFLFVSRTNDMDVDSHLHKFFFRKPFARVLYFNLIKDKGR